MLGLPDTTARNLEYIFPGANPEAMDLLSKMLIFDPMSRITVEQALGHPYLAPLREEASETLAERPVDCRGIEEVIRCIMCFKYIPDTVYLYMSIFITVGRRDRSDRSDRRASIV